MTEQHECSKNKHLKSYLRIIRKSSALYIFGDSEYQNPGADTAYAQAPLLQPGSDPTPLPATANQPVAAPRLTWGAAPDIISDGMGSSPRKELRPPLMLPCVSAVQVAISSLAFAAAHLSGPDFVPLATLGAVLGGTLLAAEGNLVAPTLAHSIYNAVIILSIAAYGS